MPSRHVYTSFPLFNGKKPCVEPHDAHLEGKNQPIQVYDQPMDQHAYDVNVDDVVDEENREIINARSMPKWLVQTLCDNSLATPLSTHTHFETQRPYFAHNCYEFATFNTYDEEEFVSFDEAQNLESWMAIIKIEYDPIVRKDM